MVPLASEASALVPGHIVALSVTQVSHARLAAHYPHRSPPWAPWRSFAASWTLETCAPETSFFMALRVMQLPSSPFMISDKSLVTFSVESKLAEYRDSLTRRGQGMEPGPPGILLDHYIRGTSGTLSH